MGDIKQRIHQKLGVSEEEFAKWKFGLLHPYMGKPRLIQGDFSLSLLRALAKLILQFHLR